MMWKILLESILIVAIQGQLSLSRQHGCPLPEDIYPCKCLMHGSIINTLKCKHLTSNGDFKAIIEKSRDYTFDRVFIENSQLEYLPKTFLEHVEMRQLVLSNLSLTKAFESSPKALEKLDKLVIQRVKVESGSVWEILQPLKTLRTLHIKQIPMKTVEAEFLEYVTEDLRTLHVIDTEIESINPGTFHDLPNLHEVQFINGSLRTLPRGLFTEAFIGDSVSFDYQKLTEIEDYAFYDTPNLRHLSLVGNQLTMIPERAFERNLKLHELLLNDNPIECNCLLKWIVFRNVPVSGTCVSPDRLQWKRLDRLPKAYFHDCDDHDYDEDVKVVNQ